MFQSAIYMDGENEAEISVKLKKLLNEMSASWTGALPKQIPVMPENLSAEKLQKEYKTRTTIPLGLYYENIQTASMDLSVKYSMIISGTIKSGKSAQLARMIGMIHEIRPEDKIYIFDGVKESLKSSREIAYQYGRSDDAIKMKEMLDEIVNMLNQRKNGQNRARKAAGDFFDEKEYIKNTEQICIFIDDLKEFVDEVEDESKNSMERICRLAQNLGVIVFAACRVADLEKYNAIESLTRVLVSNQQAMIMSGSAAVYTMFDNDLAYNEKNVELENGDAYLYCEGKCSRIRRADD